MNRISIAIVATCLSIFFPLHKCVAQLDYKSMFSSTNPQLVAMCLEDVLVGVTRSYVICDSSGYTYTQEGKSSFNDVPSFAVRINGGLLIPPAVVRPWEDDPLFQEYKDSYDGQGRKLTIRFDKPMELDSVQAKKACRKDELLYMLELDSTYDGISMGSQKGDVDGWVLLVKQEKDSLQLLSPFKKKINIKSNGDTYEVSNPIGASNVLGGIFVEPVITSIGIIEFRLCGVIINKDEKLTLVIPSMERRGDAPSARRKLSKEPEVKASKKKGKK
ncbi:MAG: hypothetical protein J6I49_06660 [Bacteroidales bacterium]|nr:hypothetical protein [Bacteroidales bacterium]